jgi:uncharacterized protein with HEPN domain
MQSMSCIARFKASRGLEGHAHGIPWQQIKAIGNILPHEYHGLSDNIIWKAITDELPRLRVAVAAILDQMNRA